MWGRPVWLGIIAGVGAFVAWLCAEPFLPFATIESSQTVASHFTLGTFYGWFSNLLFGACVCGPLAFLIAEPRTSTGKAFLSGLLGLLVGGGLVCGADAVSDYTGIRMGESSELPAILWSFLVAAAMAFSIALACQPNPKRLKRALTATGIGGAAGFMARLFVAPLIVVFLIAQIGTSAERLHKLNTWSIASKEFLIQNVVMAVVMGLVLGFVEHFSREAWLRVEVARGEGRDYTLDRPETRIGSAEGADIPLRGDPSIMPWHARILSDQPVYTLVAASGSLFLNGSPVTTAHLSHGDSIGIGNLNLIFLEKGGQRKAVPAPSFSSAWQVPAPSYPPPSASILHPNQAMPTPTSQWLECPPGNRVALRQGINPLGRHPDSVLDLMHDSSISRTHAEIVVRQGAATLRDLGSRNGTTLNGQRIVGEVTLKPGETIQLGNVTAVYRI